MARVAQPAGDKLVDLARLTRIIDGQRTLGRTLVFTNGCFDLLHAGHLRLLEQCAELADRLLVGVNSDESVRRIKGAGRPIIPFEERALILAGLAVVDWVVGFDTDTPLGLIHAVQPDVLVKGGDWPLERIVGREFVESRGGRVVTLPLTPGHSSTRIRRRLLRPAAVQRPSPPSGE